MSQFSLEGPLRGPGGRWVKQWQVYSPGHWSSVSTASECCLRTTLRDSVLWSEVHFSASVTAELSDVCAPFASCCKPSVWGHCPATISLSTEVSILLTNEYLDDISLEKPTPEGSHTYDQEWVLILRGQLCSVFVVNFKMSQSSVLSFSGLSSENWLKTHGLVARKLTIMDALLATAVPHSPTYIPILGKHVTSKVFDEVNWLSVSLLDVVFISCLNEKPSTSMSCTVVTKVHFTRWKRVLYKGGEKHVCCQAKKELAFVSWQFRALCLWETRFFCCSPSLP